MKIFITKLFYNSNIVTLISYEKNLEFKLTLERQYKFWQDKIHIDWFNNDGDKGGASFFYAIVKKVILNIFWLVNNNLRIIF